MKVGNIEFDPKEIIQAYVTKFTATEDQKKLAEARLNICNGCENRTSFLNTTKFRCAKCGCILDGKVFTNREDRCPEHKWRDVELEYFNERSKEALKSGKLI